MTAIRTLKVAGVQVESRYLDVQGNLRRAEVLVAVAAERGAELVLCPEFLAPGYVYDSSIWDVAEPHDGPPEAWLTRMARKYRLYIGASYLEASGDDFFNTFTLMKPDGTVSGRVRKQSLPGFEGWFFNSCSGPKLIETEFGRVGIGICWDNNTSRFMREMNQQQIDLLRRGTGHLRAECITVVDYVAPDEQPAKGKHPVLRRFESIFGREIDFHTSGFNAWVQESKTHLAMT